MLAVLHSAGVDLAGIGGPTKQADGICTWLGLDGLLSMVAALPYLCRLYLVGWLRLVQALGWVTSAKIWPANK